MRSHLWALLVVWLAYWIMACLRNRQVYWYRLDLIEAISEANRAEPIYCYCIERWKWYDSPGYLAMVFKVWRPIDSFYPDREKMLSPRCGK